MTYQNALGYAMAIVMLSALSLISFNRYVYGGYHAGMKIRVAVCSLIYRKALRLSQTALRETSLVNLLSNDVSRFDLVSCLVHYMWTSPIMTIIIGYFLWLQARWAGMIGIAVVFSIVAIQCKKLRCKNISIAIIYINTTRCSIYLETCYHISITNCSEN